jgi:GNAT superfamily N-acetyltransferase
MSSGEVAFMIASVDALLIAEPTVESRPILDADLPAVAQLMLDATTALPGHETTLEGAMAKISALLAGETVEPRRDTWLGVWEGYGAPVSVILSGTWRGMPCITHVLTVPAARNRGYASSLVREVAQVVEASGGTHVGLKLAPDNPSTHLLRELGFVEMFTPADL